MRALIIYDQTGRIWSIAYGVETVPQGLLCMFVDIPNGAQIQSIDITDSNNPKPVFTYLPESDIGRLQDQMAEMEDQLTQTQLALTKQYETNLSLQEELTNTQLALTELYEGLEV